MISIEQYVQVQDEQLFMFPNVSLADDIAIKSPNLNPLLVPNEPADESTNGSPHSSPNQKVILPSIFSSFDPANPNPNGLGLNAHSRRADLDLRRGSLPNLYSDSLSAHRARVPVPSSLGRSPGWAPSPSPSTQNSTAWSQSE